MGIFATAAELAKSGGGSGDGVASELYALACAKAAERVGRKTGKKTSAREMENPLHAPTVEFELQILQSLALCGWMLDAKQSECRKSFLSPEAQAMADKVLVLLADGAPAHYVGGPPELEITLPRAAMDALLARES